MGTDSGSGETSCDEASHYVAVKHNDYPLVEASGYGNKILVPLCTKLELVDTPIIHFEENALMKWNSCATKDESVQSENEYVDILSITDSETPCTTTQAASSERKRLRNACTFPGCSLSFNRPWRLEAHIRAHNGERPFKCTVDGCSKDYSNNAHLRRHIARNHSTNKSRVNYECPFPGCFMILSNKTAVKRHQDRKHVPQFCCSQCNEKFIKQIHLQMHMICHRPNTDLPYKCDICQLTFVTKREHSRHRVRKHRTYICDHLDCGQVFSTWSSLRKHWKIEHPTPKFVCDVCNRTFAVKINLQLHLETHFDPENRQTYKCQFQGCTSFYYHHRNLCAHIKSNHQGKLFVCSFNYCSQQLSSKQKLVEHLARHNSITIKKNSSQTKKRKDKGKLKRSMTSRLLGVNLPPEEENMLLSNNNPAMLSDSSVDMDLSKL